MRMSLVAMAWVLLASVGGYAQDAPQIAFTGGAPGCADAYVVGEVHTLEDLATFKVAYTDYLYRTCDVSTVVIEYGKSRAYLSNMYLETGDTTLLSANKSHNSFMKGLRALNLANPSKKPVRVYGMDFERACFVEALKYMFDHNSNAACRQTAFYSYLSSVPPALVHELNTTYITKKWVRRETMRLYEEAQVIFSREKEELKQILGADFATAEDIMTNAATPRMRERDRTMCLNLQKIAAGGQKFVCFVGKAHTNTGYNNPLICRYLAGGGNAARTTLVTMVCTSYKASIAYLGMPKAAWKDEENQKLMNGMLLSDDHNFRLVPAAKLAGITEEYSRGMAAYYLFVGK